jgi:hypothetical protein
MWISRAQFFDLAAKAALAEGKAATLAEQNMVLRTSLDWMQIRVRQIETERAQLLFMVSGVKATVPVVESVSKRTRSPRLTCSRTWATKRPSDRASDGTPTAISYGSNQ